MLKFGGMPAAEAVQALATIRGPSFKPILLELLDREKKDYNFSVNGIARALAPLLDKSDLPRLLDIAVDAASMEGHENAGNAVGVLLKRFDPDALIIAARARAGSPLPPNLVRILCEALAEREDKRSFEILADFVLESYDKAIFLLMRTDEAVPPAHLFEVFGAGGIAREEPLKLPQRPRKRQPRVLVDVHENQRGRFHTRSPHSGNRVQGVAPIASGFRPYSQTNTTPGGCMRQPDKHARKHRCALREARSARISAGSTGTW